MNTKKPTRSVSLKDIVNQQIAILPAAPIVDNRLISGQQDISRRDVSFEAQLTTSEHRGEI